MKRSGSWQTWLIVAALLIFAGIASAVVPFLFDQLGGQTETVAVGESHPNVTTIDVSQLPFIGEVLVEIPFIAEYIQGQPITMIQAFGIALGVVLVSVGGLGVIITILTLLFSRFVTRVYADESYQETVAVLEQRQKETIRSLEAERPVTEPAHAETRARGSLTVFAAIIVILVWIASIVFGIGLFQDDTIAIGSLEMSAVAVTSLIAVLITIAVLFFSLRRRDEVELETSDSDNQAVNWGAIWVIVTGMLIVGIGTGLAIALASGG